MTNKRRPSKQLPEKLEAFVGDVLNVYKLDMGKLSISKYDVHCVELINSTISVLTPILLKSNRTQFRY
jgi:hypothetical protein